MDTKGNPVFILVSFVSFVSFVFRQDTVLSLFSNT
jgi:hypothetical protein